MALPEEVMEKLKSKGRILAEIPAADPELRAWVKIIDVKEQKKTRWRPYRAQCYVVIWAEVRQKYLEEYWIENIDIGGYTEYSERYEKWIVTDEEELEQVVMSRVDDPMLFLVEHKPPDKFPG